ncbi:hypothetical protein ASC96_29510 [Rhizobium sp. Root1204]|nr:hypothetical protein ASC96_29510 [Rhizobium sp. Root1204]
MRRKPATILRQLAETPQTLAAEKALVMGQQHSWGTFSYQSAKLSDEPTTIHMAYFRRSFALMLADSRTYSTCRPL